MEVGKQIKFCDVADRNANVEGNFDLEKVTFYDDFLGDLLADEWAPDTDTNGTTAIAAASGGVVALITHTDDDDRNMLSHGVTWLPTKNCIMETRITMTPITTIGVFVGFTDEAAEAAQTMPFALAVATLTDTATNGVGFLFDTDATTDVWNIVNTNAGTDAFTALASTYDPVALTYQTFRVEIVSPGVTAGTVDAYFYINGEPVGYKAAAVAISTLLCPNVSVQNKNGATHTVNVDYVKCWQDR